MFEGVLFKFFFFINLLHDSLALPSDSLYTTEYKSIPQLAAIKIKLVNVVVIISKVIY